MLPRSKLGPSWANEAQPLAADLPELSRPKSKKLSSKEPPAAEVEERQEGVSDLDWMRQRMSKKVDDKGFEQSDDEVEEEEQEKEVSFQPNSSPSPH